MNNHVVDVVRGTDSNGYLVMQTDATYGESVFDTSWHNTYGKLTSISGNNFTVVSGSSNGGFNTNSVTYVGWGWDAGSSTVTNTQGSITSTVRANATAGFSIVSYTGTGSGSDTVGHGLGVAPSLIFCKTRAAAVQWVVYHKSLGKDYFLGLNTTDAANNTSNYWGSGGVTSTVFGLQNVAGGNNNGSMIAYCFAPVVGYSSMGSYVGNGSSTNGPFVYTGFRPRFILTKATDSALDWNVFDAARDSYNSVNKVLFPNLSNQESDYIAYTPFDFVSNGFKLRSSIVWNASSTTYIYAAFAEAPFNYSRAR